MKRRLISLLMVILLAVSFVPVSALAAPKQMEPGVPVWGEDTVKEYAFKYIRGEELEKLRGYYDLQVRRYMPMETYVTMLTEIHWMTGDFVGFGTYSSFEEPAEKTKTHVLHLCMEKQDLDLYFTHKNKPDDWEVMGVEFALAERQEVSVNPLASSGAEADAPAYSEEKVTVGSAPFELEGILTLPAGASAQAPVRACVLVQGSGPLDKDSTVGQTKLFADLAKAFAERGIATLRYDKRTYTYGQVLAQNIEDLSVEEETIQDAIAAGKLLQSHEAVNSKQIVLVGHSMGAMLAPRIVTEAGGGVFGAMLLIAGTPKTLLELVIEQNQVEIAKMKEEDQGNYNALLAPLVEQAGKLSKMKAEDVKQVTLFGQNAFYFWEMEQHDAISMMKKLKLPTYIVQGSNDFQVSVASGIEAYEDRLGENVKYVSYATFRGLNHMLMQFTGDANDIGTVREYNAPATLDVAAARNLVAWINELWAED